MRGSDALGMEEDGMVEYDRKKREYIPAGVTTKPIMKKARKKRTAVRRKLNKLNRRQRW